MDLETLRNQNNRDVANEVEESLLSPAGWYRSVPEWSVMQRETDGDAVLRFYGAAKLAAADEGADLATDAYEKVYRTGFNVNFSNADTSRGMAVKLHPQVRAAFRSAMGKEAPSNGDVIDYLTRQPFEFRQIQLPARDAGVGRDGRQYEARGASTMVVAVRAAR